MSNNPGYDFDDSEYDEFVTTTCEQCGSENMEYLHSSYEEHFVTRHHEKCRDCGAISTFDEQNGHK